MRILCVAACASLTACTSVELQFQDPQSRTDEKAIAAQADDGYQYFTPNRFVLLVAPTTSISKSAGDAKAGSGKKPDTQGQATPSASSLDNTLIDGIPWAAVVTPVADHSRALMVRGYSGFWAKTALKLTKVSNSDRVTGVTVAAENLFPKRLEQLGAILSSVVAFGGAVAGAATKMEPFALDIPPVSMKKRETLQDGWTYQFIYPDEAKERSMVSFEQFRKLTTEKKVGYWPVPACRNAVLSIYHDQSEYKFDLTVAHSDALRLEPLPVAGGLQFGDICSSTTNTTGTADAVGDIVADLAAVEKLVKTVKSLKSK